jgi:hypothetical protein
MPTWSRKEQGNQGLSETERTGDQPLGSGLLHAAREGDEETEEHGEKTTVERAPNESETCCARRVSMARPALGDFGRATLDRKSGEEMGPGEKRAAEEDLRICKNSPTNPGTLLAARS